MIPSVIPLKSYSLATRGGRFEAVLREIKATRADGSAVDIEEALGALVTLLETTRERGGAVFLIGNGGSAAVAAHIANDLVNVAKLRALTLHDTPVLTCMANDYGYENAYARLVETMIKANDVLIAISSSGKSPNIRSATQTCRAANATAVTLSGFRADNPLRQLGNINIWAPSDDYGMVEIAHLFVLHNLADRLSARARDPA